MPISADDPRVIRIARALAEGCDGRECASEDANRIYAIYQSHREGNPSISFTDCRELAFREFIAEVLG